MLTPCDNAVTEDDRLECARRTIQDIIDRLESSARDKMTKPEYCADHVVELKDNLEEAIKKKQEGEAKLGKVVHDCEQCTEGDKINAENDIAYEANRIRNIETQIDALESWCSV